MLRYTLRIVPGYPSFLLRTVGNLSVKRLVFTQPFFRQPFWFRVFFHPVVLLYPFIQFSNIICFAHYSHPRTNASELITAIRVLQAAGGSLPAPSLGAPSRRAGSRAPPPSPSVRARRGRQAGRHGVGAPEPSVPSAPPGARPLRSQVSPPRHQHARCCKLRSDGWCAEG